LERVLGGVGGVDATSCESLLESFEPVHAVRAYTTALRRLDSAGAAAAVGPALRHVLRILAKPKGSPTTGTRRTYDRPLFLEVPRQERESRRLAATLAPLVARVIAAASPDDARWTGFLYLRLLRAFPKDPSARNEEGIRTARLALVESALGAAHCTYRLAWLPHLVLLYVKIGAIDEARYAIAAARVTGTESERAIALQATTRLIQKVQRAFGLPTINRDVSNL
jgi:hypothetical protein